jgi:hypothetical protein
MLTFLNVFLKIRVYVLICWSFSYSLLLSNREYNISFIPSGGDDVIGYAKVIENLINLNFVDIFNPQIMSGYEPVSQVIWWVSINIGLLINQIIFFQLVAWTLVLVILANHVSKRFSVFILMIGLGMYPEIIPLQFHSFYRSSWAFLFISLAIVYAENKKANLLIVLAFFSHFTTGIVIFFKLIFERNKLFKLIFQKHTIILLFLAIFVLVKMDLLSGIFSKIMHYYSSYTHVFHLGIIKSQLFGASTLVLFYFFSSKSTINKYIFYSAFTIYVVTFIPFISWVSMRLFVLVAPIAFMVCAPLRNKHILYGAVFLSLFRYVSNISSEYSIYNAWGTEFIFISLVKVFGVM